MKLDSVYVVVRDMKTSTDFYRQVFAREPILIDERFSGFELGGALFGLFNASSFGEPVDSRELIYGNNCVANVRVDALDPLHQRLNSLADARVTGIQAVREYRLFQVEDPDGNRVEFYEER